MLDKVYVGLDLTGFENNGIQRPISRITLMLDDQHEITAGDDSGMELKADCPHATQAMVNAILAELKGSKYQMYGASNAKFDPAAELGDGITASGVYSVISRLDDDGMGFPDPSAPGQAELEDEYPLGGGPMTETFERQFTSIRSSITKTAEEIRLKVEDIDSRLSSITTRVDGITLSVENGSTSSTIKLMSGSVEIASQDIVMTGLVTLQGLSSGTTTIDGSCIKTGTISGVDISGTTISGTTINGGEINGTTITGGEITGTTINGGTITGALLKGEKLQLVNPENQLSAEIGFTGKINTDTSRIEIKSDLIYLNAAVSLNSDSIYMGHIYSESGSVADSSCHISTLPDCVAIMSVNGHDLRLGRANSIYLVNSAITIKEDSLTFDYYGNGTVHCYNNLDMHYYEILNTSDARMKTNIQRANVNAMDTIKAIKIYSFDWKESGEHERIGFVAQQLEQDVCPDFVDVSKTDGHYSTKDMKMIPYLVKAIQELSEQLERLKGAGT